MPETPNNDLEKQLRDYAQQRRDAAGTPELHPATRAMLQAEVKQRLGSAGATTAPTQRAGWTRFWPRLAFALGVIAILGVAAILIIPPGDKPNGNFTLAKLDETKSPRAASDKLEAAPTPAPTALPAPSAPAAPAAREVFAKSAEPATSASRVNALEESTRRDAPTARKEAAKSFKAGTEQIAPAGSPSVSLTAAAPPADAAQWGDRITSFDVNAKPVTGSLAGKSGVASDQAVGGGGVATLAKTAAPVMSKGRKPGSAMIAAKEADEVDMDFSARQTSAVGEVQTGMTQRYRNVVVAEKQKPSDQLPVLDEFTVAQNGEALTIVDRDGSVYNGYARLAPAERQGGNEEASGAMQLVPNSYSGGRGGALFNQSVANRSLDDSRAQSQSQNLRLGQSAQTQSVGAQNAIEPLNYFFRVEGTNRSLSQHVIVTGNLWQNGGVYNYASPVQNAGGAQVFQQQASPASNASFNNTLNAPLPNNFINGRVLLNNKHAGELNALSVDK